MCAHDDYANLPHDILLNLALVQLPSVQSTSGSDSRSDTPLLRNVIRFIRRYVGVDINTALRRHNIYRATFRSLVVVVHSDAFLGDVLSHSDKLGILHALFRTLVKDSTLVHDFSVNLSDAIVQTISDVVFLDFPESVGIVAKILQPDWHSEMNSSSNGLAREICRQLHQRDWLGVVHGEIVVPLFSGLSSEPSLFRLCFRYALLASAYVDTMQATFSVARELHDEMLSYVLIGDYAVSVCLMLIICGRHGASRLSIFCAFLEPSLWIVIHQKLLDILHAETSRDLYNRYSEYYSRDCYSAAGVSSLPLAYHRYEEIILAVNQAEVVASDSTSDHTPLSPPHEKASTVRFHFQLSVLTDNLGCRSLPKRVHLPLPFALDGQLTAGFVPSSGPGDNQSMRHLKLN
ncbi:hypothetical protein BDZ89DRAFT_1152661 [Hymenopellis radicata]|nr:hypothetical protein BDZ89DRAFT_1152661 [Hymenopellis radicata]